MTPPVVFFNFSERPSPPSRPDVKGVTARSIFVTWTPRFNGNAQITQYTVQCKRTNQGWVDSQQRVVSGKSPGLDWTELSPASEYDLRVYAKNDLGNSDPSLHITAKTLEAGRACSVVDYSPC